MEFLSACVAAHATNRPDASGNAGLASDNLTWCTAAASGRRIWIHYTVTVQCIPSSNREESCYVLCKSTQPTLIMYSIRLCECFSMTDSIQMSGFTCNRHPATWSGPSSIPPFTAKDIEHRRPLVDNVSKYIPRNAWHQFYIRSLKRPL